MSRCRLGERALRLCLTKDSMFFLLNLQKEAHPNFSEKCYRLVVMQSLSAPRNQKSFSTCSIFMVWIGCMYMSACKHSNIIIRNNLSKLIYQNKSEIRIVQWKPSELFFPSHTAFALVVSPVLSFKPPLNWTIIVCQHIQPHKCKINLLKSA